MDANLAQYARMQKTFYDDQPHEVEEVVGNYAFHENFPYETHLLHRFGDIRKPVLTDPASARGFDIGCGEGRMIRRMSRFLAHCDGADISAKMVEAARIRTPAATVYLTRGDGRPRILAETHPNCHGWDDTWFTHMAFFHLQGPRKLR